MDRMARVEELGVVVAVGILDVEGGFADVAAAGRRVGHRAFAVVRSPPGAEGFKRRRIRDLRAEMEGLQHAVFLDGENQLHMVRLHGNDGLSGRCRKDGNEGGHGCRQPTQVFHSQ